KITRIELVDHDLTVERSRDAPHLPPRADILSPEVPFHRLLGRRPAWHAGQVEVEQLQLLLIIVPVSLTMRAENLIHGCLHLPDVLRCAVVESLLHDRLFGTRGAPKGSLESGR